MSTRNPKASRRPLGDSVSVRKLRACNPSMKVPGDGQVEVPEKRFDMLGGNRSAAHYADVMLGGRGATPNVAKAQRYGRRAK
jgi:hypothetical protein